MFTGQKKGSVHSRMIVRSQKDNVHESVVQSMSCFSKAEK